MRPVPTEDQCVLSAKTSFKSTIIAGLERILFRNGMTEKVNVTHKRCATSRISFHQRKRLFLLCAYSPEPASQLRLPRNEIIEMKILFLLSMQVY